MKWLTSDFSDFYIEEEQIYNPCGELIKSFFYIRYAYYGGFCRKKYQRLIESTCTHDGDIVINELFWRSKEEALDFWKKFKSSQKLIIHQIKCNE